MFMHSVDNAKLIVEASKVAEFEQWKNALGIKCVSITV